MFNFPEINMAILRDILWVFKTSRCLSDMHFIGAITFGDFSSHFVIIKQAYREILGKYGKSTMDKHSI